MEKNLYINNLRTISWMNIHFFTLHNCFIRLYFQFYRFYFRYVNNLLINLYFNMNRNAL